MLNFQRLFSILIIRRIKVMSAAIVCLLLIVNLPVFAFNPNPEGKNYKDSCSVLRNQNDYFSANTDKMVISDEIRNGLIHMRVEEKLARDVYITLGEIWGVRIFKNIQRSEQRHMDAIKPLLKFYNIPDPAENDEVGIFSISEFQKLYDELIEKGSKTYQDAIQAGITIEELDIADLENQLALVNQSDIKIVYENLIAASERHLNAFNRHINKN